MFPKCAEFGRRSGGCPRESLAAESRAKSAANGPGVSGETCRTEKERERFLVVRMTHVTWKRFQKQLIEEKLKLFKFNPKTTRDESKTK